MPALGLHTALPEQSRAVVGRKELMRIKGHSKSPGNGFHTQTAESPNSDAPGKGNKLNPPKKNLYELRPF